MVGREFIQAWLDDANRVLRPGGLIYVSTPNHDGSNDKLPEDHVYEWGFDELKKEQQDQPDDVESVTLNIADGTL